MVKYKWVLMSEIQDQELDSFQKLVGINPNHHYEWQSKQEFFDAWMQFWFSSKQKAYDKVIQKRLVNDFGCTFKIVPVAINFDMEDSLSLLNH